MSRFFDLTSQSQILHRRRIQQTEPVYTIEREMVSENVMVEIGPTVTIKSSLVSHCLSCRLYDFFSAKVGVHDLKETLDSPPSKITSTFRPSNSTPMTKSINGN